MKIEFFSLSQDFELAKNIADHFGKSLFMNQSSMFSGPSAEALAKEDKKNLFVPEVVRFADSEICLKLPKEVDLKDKHAIVIHSTCAPVNDNIVQLLFLIHDLKNNGAKKVSAIVPYFGYSRQCIDDKTGKPSSCCLIAKALELAGADEVFVVEAHDKELETFFSVPFFNIKLNKFIAAHIKKNFENLNEFCLVAPDGGAKERVEVVSEMLDLPAFFFSKKRSGRNKIEIIGMSGVCAGKTAILIDDIFDTGSTAIKSAASLIDQGATQVYGYFVHPVFSGDAAQKIEKGLFEKVFVSNSITLPPKVKSDKIEPFDISDPLIRTVENIIR